ncbi:MAG: type IV-A pilus assembly ATPase PilB [Candidatus Latescibacteria bacterium]|nr:type IV-A pilus assembly ATPase PilB [Candidatus Latescibacterota bacterium]NIM21010.1 type IV-A pilus assembly ATPase PilB [Candidatus Latescibacterota bacterium]NIM65145.1 type IV-A pilus assembly ATPase PilB [Candidatus Latescibacterota bacterium]NIO01660.1 type IV-A pilus assembly ATPase PilB [Candidatus Latescibacterota bacterium]NIO28177.1 type IV-A pilus assembly ATPase PilB [Candidatus Latescibacterota bacterium]
MKDTIAKKLVESSLVSQEELAKALQAQKKDGGSLGYNLVKTGAISELAFAEFMGQLYNVPAMDLDGIQPDEETVGLIPAEVATKFQVVPVRREGRVLTVAMANPDNIFAIDDIKFITGFEVRPVVATETAIKRSIDRLYDSADSLASVMRDIEEDIEIVEDAEEDLGLEEARSDHAPVVKLVNSLISDAVAKGASDIHIEPYEKKVRVRYRIDGMLHEMMSPPFKMKGSIISRLKIMSELDIAEKRIPQDGRIKLRIGGKSIDLRVSTLPTIFGEKVVMRILDQSNLEIDLAKLGFEDKALAQFLAAIESPYGMVLVTGPTGSGKSTTLYSALQRINKSECNIMTAEDPVEYNLEGINQVNMHEEIGLDFATSLKAFLRQDPNIIMVGEVRDLETASIAIKAALTGHLVMSTLHTNDAASSINRLIDMGIEPFLVSSSVIMIIAQRLVRKLCPKCKEQVKLHEETLRELGIMENPDELSLYEAKGCVACNETGYSGRLGLYEVMPISPKIREMILERRSVADLKKQSIEEGMLTLRLDGLRKFKLGMTSLEEVLRETSEN